MCIVRNHPISSKSAAADNPAQTPVPAGGFGEHSARVKGPEAMGSMAVHLEEQRGEMGQAPFAMQQTAGVGNGSKHMD